MPELLSSLGAGMLLPQDELVRLIRSAPHRYKVYQIPKRAEGQFRTIAQPAKEVKALQRWVMEHVLNRFRVHPAATGYRRNLNIADNARRHARSRFLLKLDFTDFFPSIKASDFKLYMAEHAPEFTELEVDLLARILFWNPRDSKDLCLSIGAPSSPLLSNLLLWDFDSSVATFCKRLRVSYTRYADDLSFSASKSESLKEVEEMVGGLCEGLKAPKLNLNLEKTVRVSKKRSRRVTGLVLTNDGKVSLGRDQKRQIRATVHHFIAGRLTDDERGKLRGTLAYVNSVEPSFLTRLRRRYGSDVIRSIQKTT
jgi:RNA-directed DNA polymerase